MTIWTCSAKYQGAPASAQFPAPKVGIHEPRPGMEKVSNDPAVIEEILRSARTIAVVGMSDKTWRASHNIGLYLAENGYRVLPVNPALSEVLGMKCYPDVDGAQAAAREQNGASIDLVDVFR